MKNKNVLMRLFGKDYQIVADIDKKFKKLNLCLSITFSYYFGASKANGAQKNNCYRLWASAIPKKGYDSPLYYDSERIGQCKTIRSFISNLRKGYLQVVLEYEKYKYMLKVDK